MILLPPSEGKSSGGDGAPLVLNSLSFKSLNPMRERIAKALISVSDRPRSSRTLLGVKGPALEKARAENAELRSAPTLPVIQRYTGVMYDAIEHETLGTNERGAFGRSVIIMSGLFGMVRPFDMIPAYKLKMGGKLMRGKSCAAVWKRLITESLADSAQGGVVWDLLPNEHSAAWDSSSVHYASRFTVKFVQHSAAGQIKTVNHWSKLLKAALVRHLVSNEKAAGAPDSALDLVAGFSHPEGYEFSEELTSTADDVTDIVFVKG
ncbi:MAG: peroxide stress protein YaaA [Dehalococcoidia bacterium]|nr:peroxide stress protein YaaA [Dehalococcoidia bacterium]